MKMEEYINMDVKLRTINGVVREIKLNDKDTAVTTSMIRKLVTDGEIKIMKKLTKKVYINLYDVYKYLGINV
jgi:phosphoribosylaminoimidazole-succinocarboxamide synthase